MVLAGTCGRGASVVQLQPDFRLIRFVVERGWLEEDALRAVLGEVPPALRLPTSPADVQHRGEAVPTVVGLDREAEAVQVARLDREGEVVAQDDRRSVG